MVSEFWSSPQFPGWDYTPDNQHIVLPLKPCPVHSSNSGQTRLYREVLPSSSTHTDLFYQWPSYWIIKCLGSFGIICVNCLPMILTLFSPILPKPGKPYRAHTYMMDRRETKTFLLSEIILFVSREVPLKHGIWRILMSKSIEELRQWTLVSV